MSTDDSGKENEYCGKRYYGKYRGKVIINIDPLHKGRIQALVPSVSQHMPSNWANPCVPYAGFGVGTFFVPPLNANVWIEYEEGNPQYPIWVGGFWDEKDISIVPTPVLIPGDFTIRTVSGNTIKLQDGPPPLGIGPVPSITLETIDQKRVSLGVSGIEISWLTTKILLSPIGEIRIFSPTKVAIVSPTNVAINGP
jgi:Type VI secretion system/phage-baseplate injector OB domain